IILPEIVCCAFIVKTLIKKINSNVVKNFILVDVLIIHCKSALFVTRKKLKSDELGYFTDE
ncbi:MAG: hypothetical protein ABF268_10430, partial [Polaribacter sp.]